MRIISRKKLYVTGLIAILITSIVIRTFFFHNADFASGTIISSNYLQDFNPSMVGLKATIFKIKDKEFFFFHRSQFVKYEEGEKVQVIYKKNNPEDAYIFSFMGFWFAAIMWCLGPVMFFSAFLLSFYNKNQYFSIVWKFPFLIKKSEMRVI